MGHLARFSSALRRLALVFALVASLLPIVAADVASADVAAPVTSLDGLDANEAFGTSVASDGVHHIVGGGGSASAVERTGDWGPRVALQVPGGNPTSFGADVALDIANDGLYGIAVVGAPFDPSGGSNAGSAHVFEYSPVGGWVFVESYIGTTVNEVVGSGVEVQILGDDRTANVLVGAQNRDGAGYVASWIRQNGVSSAVDVVTAMLGGDVGDRFGSSVAVDGDTMVVGSPLDIDGGSNQIWAGTSTVFTSDPAAAIAGAGTMAWVEAANLSLCGVAAPGEAHDVCGTSTGEQFGHSVAVDGDLIVAGAWLRSAPGGGDAGSVSVFRRTATDWAFETHLYHLDPQPTDRLGTRVAVEGRLILSTARFGNGGDGAVHAFVFDGLSWGEEEEIVAEGTGTAGGEFGTGLSLDGSTVVIGAPKTDVESDSTLTDAGRIWAYDITVPAADYPPITLPDNFSTWPSDTATFDVLANDIDPEGNPLTLAGFRNGPNHGTVDIVGDEIDYTPAAGFVGVDTFEYRALDGLIAEWGTINVTVGSEVRIDDVTVAEGAGTAEVSVVVDPPTELGVTFAATYADGTASQPADFTAGLGVFAIEPGGAETTISVPIVDDAVVEPDETFTVSLTDVTGAEPVDTDAVVTITNDDEAAEVSATIRQRGGPAGSIEFAETGGLLGTYIELSAPLDVTATVELATVEGTATPGLDYVAMSTSVTFPAGQTTAAATVQILDNAAYEGDETFDVALTGAGPAGRVSLAEPATLTVTITDDEDNSPPPGPGEGDPAPPPAPTNNNNGPTVESVCNSLLAGAAALDPTAWFEGLTLPSLPGLPTLAGQLSDEQLGAVAIDPPDCQGFTGWQDFLDWLERLLAGDPDDPEDDVGEVTNSEGAARAVPQARVDRISIKRGDSGSLNVMDNDWDTARRRLTTSLVDGGLPTGLVDVTMAARGATSITASPDFVGTAQLFYELCPIVGQCATGTILVEVVDGPITPQLFPDHVAIANSELLTYRDVTEIVDDWGPNVLANDEGVAGLDLTLVSVSGAPTYLDVEWRPDGQVRLQHLDRPGFVVDGPAEDIELTYEACTTEGACAETTLTVHYQGETGPDTTPDFANGRPYGRVEIDPFRNDPDSDIELKLVAAGAAPESAASVTDARQTADGRVVVEIGPNPDPIIHVLEYICRAPGGVIDAMSCTTEWLTIYIVDDVGPVAIDDHFTLPVGAAWRERTTGAEAVVLDVLGNGGNGQDEFWGKAGQITAPVFGEPLAVNAESPDGSQSIAFANVYSDGSQLLLGAPFVTELVVPEAGWTASFDYQICDYEPDGSEGQCDWATVTIDFVAEPDAEIDPDHHVVGLWSDGAGGWNIPFGVVDVTPSANIQILETDDFTEGFTVTASVDAGAGTITNSPTNTPDVEPIWFEPAAATLADGEVRRSIPIAQTVTNPLSTGSTTSTVSFVRNDVFGLPAVIDVGVDGVEIDLADYVSRTPYPDAPVSIESIGGVLTELGLTTGTVFNESFYRITGPTVAEPTTIRIDANPGVSPVVRGLRYRPCAQFTAPAARSGTELLDETVCQSDRAGQPEEALLMLRFDTTSGGGCNDCGFAPPARLPRFPFDPDSETYLEVRLDQDLPTVKLDDAADLGPLTGVVGGLDDLLRTSGVDLTGTVIAEGTWSAILGVDPDGFYVGGESTVTLDIVTTGRGSFVPAVDEPNVSVSLTAAGVATVKIQLGEAGERLRVADFAAGADPSVDVDGAVGVLGSANVAGIVTAQPMAFTSFSADTTGVTLDAASLDVPVQMTLPGTADENGDPVVIDARAVLEAGELRVTGATDVPSGTAIDGLGLRDVVLDLTVAGAPDATTVNGTITARAEVPALGFEVPITILVDGPQITVTAPIDLADRDVGPVDAPYLRFDDGTLTIVVTGNAVTGSASASVGLAATSVQVLPGNPAGSATITDVNGALATTGVSRLDFAGLTAGTQAYTAISTGAGVLQLGDPASPLLALNDVDALEGTLPITIGRIEFYADGRVIVSDGCLASAAGLANEIGLAGILPFDITSACINGNEIEVEGFFDFVKLDDLPFTPTVTIGNQTATAANAATNRFDIVFDLATLQPKELGPITIGVTDFAVDGVSADGSFTTQGYDADGFDGTFTGKLDITGSTAADGLPLGGALDVDVAGEITIDASGVAVLDLAANIGATGFIGEYLELTAGDIALATTVTATPNPAVGGPVALDVQGPGLTSAALTGVIRIPGLESDSDTGGIPVTIDYSNDAGEMQLVATAGGGQTYTAGGQDFVGVTGTVAISNVDDEVSASGLLTATEVSGTIGDLVRYSTDGVDITFDTDSGTPLLRVDGIAASILDPAVPGGPPLAALTVEYVEVGDNGSLSVGIITSTDVDRLAGRFGFGEIFPFTVTGLRIDPTDLSEITATVAGTFDFSGLEALLPGAGISAQIGDFFDTCGDLGVTATADSFCFTIAVDALAGGEITPIEFGPASLWIQNLDVAGVAGSAAFTIVGYSEGEFDGRFSGSADAATDLGGVLAANFDADFTGTILPALGGGGSMSIVATVAGGAAGGGVEGSGSATFRLTITADADGNLTVTGPVIESAEAEICIELPGFTTTTADGISCDGVFASVAVDGNIWTATVATNVDVGSTTNGLDIEGLSGTLTIDVSDPDNPIVTGSLGATRVQGVLGGLVEVETGPINFNFDANTTTPLLDPVDITGRLLDGDGAELIALSGNGLSIADDGTLDLDELRLTGIDALAREIGVADILPFAVSGIAISFVGEDLTQPDSVVIRAAGTFDLSALSAYDPIVQIGDVTDTPDGVTGDCDGLEADPVNVPDYGGTFCFGLAIDENGVRPDDFGPVTLGLRKVEFGPITLGGQLTVGGYQDGTFDSTLEGYLEITGETTLYDAPVGASGRVDISAAFGSDGAAITLDLTALLTASLQIDEYLIIEDATVGFGLGLSWDPDSGLEITDAVVDSVGAAAVQISAGGIVTLRGTNIEFPLDGVTFVRFGPDPTAPESDGEPGTASVTFGGVGEAGIEGWGGSVRNFEIGIDGSINMLPGFGITLTGASAESLGLDAWIPISVTEAGIVFNESTPDELLAGIVDRKRLDIDELTDITLIVSAELTGTDFFPVQGAVEGLEVNVRYLREWTEALLTNETPDFTRFPVTNLDAVFFGVSGLELGPVTVSGGLGFGMVPTDQGPKFWGRVIAGGTYDGFGLSIDMTLTERGPISLKVEVPAAVVLGQTTIVLAVQEVAIAFNKQIPSICTTFEAGVFVCSADDPDDGVSLDDGNRDDDGPDGPLALVNDPAFANTHLETVGEIREAIENMFAAGTPGFEELTSILPDQFALSVKGSITSVALAGQLSGNVELLISFDKPSEALPIPGVRIVGTGTLNVYGMAVGNVRLYLDYSDPLAPAFTLAAALPAEEGLLDLLIPGTVQMGVTIDSQGLYAAPILAMRELLVQVLGSAADNPEVQQIFGPLVDALLARLEASREPIADRLEQAAQDGTSVDVAPGSALVTLLLDTTGPDIDGDGEPDPDGKISAEEDAQIIDRAFFNERVQTLLPSIEVSGDGSQGDAELLFAQGGSDLLVAAQFASALVTDLFSGVADFTPVEGGLPADTTLADYIEAAVSLFLDVLTQTPDVAQLFYDVINPSVIFQGLVQYELLDIPLGEPAQEALIVIDKNEIYAEFTQSLKQTTSMALTVCYPCLIIAQALTVGLDDMTTMRFSLPFPIEELIDGEGIGALDPFTGGWSMSIDSDLFVFGFEAGTVSGIIVPGDSQAQVTSWYEQLPPNLQGDISPDTPDVLEVPDALAADGGVFVTAALQVPEMLADPLGWIDDAQGAYDGLAAVELLQLPGYLTDNADTLLATREAGNLDIFLPLPTQQELIDAGLDLGNLFLEDGSIDLAAIQAANLDLTEDLYVRGDLGATLLGYTMTDVEFSLTNDGMEGRAEFPFFGAPLTALVDNATRTVTDPVTNETEEFTWPALKIDQTVTSQDVSDFLAEYGLDALVPDFEGSATFRAYSPDYHLSQPEPEAYAAAHPLSIDGGIELVLTGGIDGVVEGGELVISIGFGVNGSLLPSSIDASISVDNFDLGGVSIDDASLTFEYRNDGTGNPGSVSADVIVDGTIIVFDVTIDVSGSLDDGRLTAQALDPIRIGPAATGITLTSSGSDREGPLVELVYDEATESASIEVAGRLYVAGWSGYATVDSSVGTGADAVIVDLNGLERDGVFLDGQMSFTTRPDGFTLTATDATVTVPGVISGLTVDAVITEQGLQLLRIENGQFDLAPGAALACADVDFTLTAKGFRLAGSATVAVDGLTELVTPGGFGGGPGGGLGGGFGGGPFAAAPPTGGGCDIDGVSGTFDLGTNGHGSVGLDVDDVGIGPVTITSVAATLQRDAKGVRLDLAGLVNVLNFQMGVDGELAVTPTGLKGDIALTGTRPTLLGWQLGGPIGLSVAPGQATRFSLGAITVLPNGKQVVTPGTIKPPGVDAVNVTGWFETDGDFDLTVSGDEVTIGGGLTVSGAISLSKVDNQMQLSIRNGSVTIGWLGTFSVNALDVSSNGSFSMTGLSLPAIGNSSIRLESAQIDMSRSGTGTIKVRVVGGNITGSYLNGQTIGLPTTGGRVFETSFSTNLSFNQDITLDALDLGPALRVSKITFAVQIGSSGLVVQQKAAVSVSALAGSTSMTLSGLKLASFGNERLTGTVRGALRFLGHKLPTTSTFEISNSGNHLRMTLTSKASITLGSLGSVTLEKPAWFQSDGTFRFTVNVDVGFDAPFPFVKANGDPFTLGGDGAITLGFGANGPYTSFSGTGCGPYLKWVRERFTNVWVKVPVLACGTATGTLASNNVLQITIDPYNSAYPNIAVTLPPGEEPAEDDNPDAPEFDSVPNQVTALMPSNSPATVEVNYDDVIDIEADNATSVTCSPASGSLFVVGETTEVKCLALGPGGSDHLSFDLFVQRDVELFSAISFTVPVGNGSKAAPPKGGSGKSQVTTSQSATLSGRGDAGSTGRAVVHSTPVELGTFVVGSDGTWSLDFTIPADLELGDHTIVVDVTIDGRRTLVQTPIEVVAELPDMDVELPATGSDTGWPLRLAPWLILAGLLALLLARRRRTAPMPTPRP